MQVRFFTVRSLPISGERNRHERASFVDPGIERGDERWLSVPLSPFLFILVRVGARRRRRAKSQEAEGEEEFPPLSFFLAGGGTGLKNRHPTGASNKKPETFSFPPLPLSFKLPSFPPSGAQTSEWKQRKRGSSSFPGFFSPSRLFRPPPTLSFPRRETGGSFFFPLLGRLRKKIGRKGRRENVKSRGKFFF